MDKREELILDKLEIEAVINMGYFETQMKLDLQSIDECLIDEENKQCEIKRKQKNKNRYDINKKHKDKMYSRHRLDVRQGIAEWFAVERTTYKQEWTNGRWTMVSTCKPWVSGDNRVNKKKTLKAKAKKKVRYTPIGKEDFALKGCGYHKVFEWRWEME